MSEQQVRVLGIETSCDETAAAIVCNGRDVMSSVLSSQIESHVPFGGVVPEVASRAHVELVMPLVSRSLVEAGLGRDDRPDVVAGTVGPGLVGALLVGLSTAKALALAWDVPFVAVNHLDAHLWATTLEEGQIEYPQVMLLVSGGHTMLVACRAPGVYELLGETRDDAAGEAFDKVGRAMGLGYPAGPEIDRLAGEGNPEAVRFPRAMPGDNYEFSFSGLKTAVALHLRKNPDFNEADIAASFQAAVVDQLLGKARRAAKEIGAKGFCLGGGVAANSALREKACDIGIELGIGVHLPSRSMCTDNAAMIATAGYHRYLENGPSPMNTGADPNMGLRIA
jgi:N6-L-threonylcarbamoyladenine synthase